MLIAEWFLTPYQLDSFFTCTRSSTTFLRVTMKNIQWKLFLKMTAAGLYLHMIQSCQKLARWLADVWMSLLNLPITVRTHNEQGHIWHLDISVLDVLTTLIFPPILFLGLQQWRLCVDVLIIRLGHPLVAAVGGAVVRTVINTLIPAYCAISRALALPASVVYSFNF